MREAITKRFPGIKVVILQGGQGRQERTDTKHEMEVGTGACVLLGNQAAGGFGISGVSIPYVFYASCTYSLIMRLQSEDRFHRQGIKGNVFYTDLVSVGPQGQQTVDGLVLKALMRKENLLTWTTQRWAGGLLAEWEN
jgi:SNF2 family DNA or RNA helicase